MNTILDIPDEELVRRAVLNARSKNNLPKWVAVMNTFGLGSTCATQLCRRFNVDPDEGIVRVKI